MLEIVEVLEKFGQAARFALGLPFLEEGGEAVDILAILQTYALGNFEPFNQVAQDVASGAAAHGLALLAQEFEQRGDGVVRGIKRQIGLRCLQDVVEVDVAFFTGTLGEAKKALGREMPGRGGKRAGAGDIVERFGDEIEIGQNIADERMLEDRKLADDERNFAPGKLLDELIAVGVLAIEYAEVAPAAPGFAKAFEFVELIGRVTDFRRLIRS